MGKTALVLGGGGMKGAYELGVWKALREMNIQIDIITGTSIGALNGALMVQGDYDFAVELWNTMNYDRIFGQTGYEDVEQVENRGQLLRLALKEYLWLGGLDVTPLHALIEGRLDEEKIRESPIAFGLVTTQIGTRESHLLSTVEKINSFAKGRLPEFHTLPTLKKLALMKEDIPKGEMVDYLMASASCYPIFKPQKIGDFYHLDGGYCDDLPIALADKLEPDEIIAVDLESIGIKSIHIPKSAGFRYIKSRWNLGELFCFQQDVVQRNITLGYYDCLKEYGQYEGKAYTFYKGSIEMLLKRDKPQKESTKQLQKFLHGMNRTQHLLGRMQEKITALHLAKGRNNLTLEMAESAGRIFLLPPDQVYTAESFNENLKKAYTTYVEQLNMPLPKILGEALLYQDKALVVSAMVQRSLEGEVDFSPLERLYGMPDIVHGVLYLLELLSE